MIELLADVDTKIYILQKYGSAILTLYSVFGNLTPVLVFLTMTHVFLNNVLHESVKVFKYFYISLLIGIILDLDTHTFLPVIEQITTKSPLTLKREYSVLTYVFGITTLRDAMDSMMMYIVRTGITLIFVSIKALAFLMFNEHPRIRNRNI